jgi:CO dehydrogenase/acetyl-CoA synthase alpha subunit
VPCDRVQHLKVGARSLFKARVNNFKVIWRSEQLKQKLWDLFGDQDTSPILSLSLQNIHVINKYHVHVRPMLYTCTCADTCICTYTMSGLFLEIFQRGGISIERHALDL